MTTDRKRFLCALIISHSVISIFFSLKATASEALTACVKIDLREKFSRLHHLKICPGDGVKTGYLSMNKSKMLIEVKTKQETKMKYPLSRENCCY